MATGKGMLMFHCFADRIARMAALCVFAIMRLVYANAVMLVLKRPSARNADLLQSLQVPCIIQTQGYMPDKGSGL